MYRRKRRPLTNLNFLILPDYPKKGKKTASVGKEKRMEDMNSFELRTFLKMIIEILNGCKDIDEAKEKIKALLS